MRLSRLSFYKYAFFVFIVVFMYSIFGRVASAEAGPSAGEDFPLTNPNIYQEGVGVTSGASVWRNDIYKYHSYYSTSDNPLFYLKRSVASNSISNYGYYLCCKNNTSVTEVYDFENLNNGNQYESRTVTRNPSSFGDYYKIAEVGVSGSGDLISTNIPIFNYEDTVYIAEYLDNGNIDNAVNKDDVMPKPEVPAPVDLDLSESSKGDFGSLFTSPIVVSWKSGSNDSFTYSNMRFNLSYEIVYGYTHMVAGVSTDGTEDTGKIQVATNVKYNNESSSYTIGVQDLNDSITRSILGLNFEVKTNWIESVTIWIQNVDNSDFTNVSGEKYVQYNFKSKTESSDSPPPSDGSTGGSPSEGGGTGTGSGSGQGSSNSSFNNSPTFNNNPNITISNSNVTGGATDNYITNAVSGFLNASDTLGQNVHSGFGLLGENGFLAAVGSMFTFVPTEIMTMIGITVAACMLMFVVGSVVWFIRG